MYICMYVCMCVRVRIRLYVCTYVCKHLYVIVQGCVCACEYVWVIIFDRIVWFIKVSAFPHFFIASFSPSSAASFIKCITSLINKNLALSTANIYSIFLFILFFTSTPFGRKTIGRTTFDQHTYEASPVFRRPNVCRPNSFRRNDAELSYRCHHLIRKSKLECFPVKKFQP